MSTTIDPAAVRAAVDLNDLQLDLPDDPALQAKVNAHFPAVFDAWSKSGSVDPYDALSADGVADEDSVCVPPGVSVDAERGRDIFSACSHTIRLAIEQVYNQDPCSSASDLTF
ncbi:hypothetical protein [Mycolicibacterium conceptionense]|nr:hypothetical protein [Mycolicibacterium conceptionense]